MENQNQTNNTYNTEIICSACNSANRSTSNFCAFCGKVLVDKKPPRKQKVFPAWAVGLLIFTVICYLFSGLFSTIGSVVMVISEDYIDGNGELYTEEPKEHYDFYDEFDKYFENYLNPQNPTKPDDESSSSTTPNSSQSIPKNYLDGVPVYSFSTTLTIEDIEVTFLEPTTKSDDNGTYTSVDFSIYNGMRGNTLVITNDCFDIVGLNNEPPITCSEVLNSKHSTISRKLLFPGESLSGTLRFDECEYSGYDSMVYCNFKINGRTIEFFVKRY